MTSGVTDTPRSGRPPGGGGLAWHTLSADQALQSEGVDGRRGLSSAEAAARAPWSGPNKLAAGKAEPRWHAFLAPASSIARGIPLLPLQTLWVSFAMLSLQSVGLGYSKPAAGLMDRAPLPPSRPILTRGLTAWLSFAALLMAVGTLGVVSWAEQAHGLAVARTMGMVTFALFLLFFSIEAKDDKESAFSVGTFSDKTFARTTAVSIVLLILSTALGIFQRVMNTVTLGVPQWLICTAVALSVVAAAEIRKAVRRRTAATIVEPAGVRSAGATAS